jgi:hypothetical protein
MILIAAIIFNKRQSKKNDLLQYYKLMLNEEHVIRI